jgi:phospholipid/cholesterol/gamma-HCH transport system permease protein
MKVTEQIDALRAMATSPTQYLVVPRLVACLVMVPALAIIADVAGIGGGYLFAMRAQNLTGTLYITSIEKYLRFSTAAAGVGKSVFFGLIIAIVACHQGLFCRQAAEDVGNATTRSVVYAILGIFVSDYFLSKLLFR